MKAKIYYTLTNLDTLCPDRKLLVSYIISIKRSDSLNWESYIIENPQSNQKKTAGDISKMLTPEELYSGDVILDMNNKEN